MLIRYYGSCGLLNGYGQAGNELVLALASAGAAVEVRVVNPAGEELRFDGYPGLEAMLRDDEQLSDGPNVILIHAQPLDGARMLAAIRERGGIDGARTVLYTTWEGTSLIPKELVAALGAFDQVWVPSEQNWICCAGAGKHVRVVPHSFDERSLDERHQVRKPTDPRPEKFTFYYLGHWNGRKNIDGLIRAFARAFTAADPVELHIHSRGAEYGKLMVASNRLGVGVRDDTAKVILDSSTLTYAEVLAVHRRNDCFVTATRGEAWNLPCFHALLAGRMIIHPRGTGAEDYLVGTGATRFVAGRSPSVDDVDISASDAGGGGARLVFSNGQGMSARTDWLEPDLIDLANVMQTVFANRLDTVKGPSNLLASLIERFGRLAVGKLAMDNLRSML